MAECVGAALGFRHRGMRHGLEGFEGSESSSLYDPCPSCSRRGKLSRSFGRFRRSVPSRFKPRFVTRNDAGFRGDLTVKQGHSGARQSGYMRSRSYDGRFCGGRRVNVESAPRLPAWLLGRIFDYALPVDLLWQSDIQQDVFTVRVVRYLLSSQGGEPVVQAEEDGLRYSWRLLMRPAPNGGRQTLVSCRDCQAWVRHLYPYVVWNDHLSLAPWHCRRCAGLRYRSEGSWVPANRIFGPFPRSWTYGDPVATPLERSGD